MTKISLLTLALAAIGCAHSPQSTSSDQIVRGTPHLVAHENLHRVAALSHTAASDGAASAELRVCVTPAGKADTVEVQKSSGSAWFDRAVVAEFRGARYQAFAAPADVRVCGPMQIIIADSQE